MRTFIILPLFLLSLLYSCNKSEETSKRPPNIVFIMTDDHAFHAISAYGSKINKTPNLDKLASEGMIFHRSYVTNSLCGPSRAVMLTGKFNHLNGFYDNSESSRFDSTQVTWPKLLQEAGYNTAVVGKWHLRSQPTGFDYWSVLPGQGDYYYPNFITMGNREREPGYVTDLITDKALGWLDTINPEKPFAILVHHKAPHRTWMPAIRHLNMYDDITIPEPETLFDDYKGRDSTAGTQEMTIAHHLEDNYDLFLGIGTAGENDWGNKYLNNQRSLMTPGEIAAWEDAYREENQAFFQNPPTGDDRTRWNYQRYIKNYLSVVAAVDESIGRITDYLKERGLDENTIVVYTSDQGFYLGDHGWYDKRWMYEESFRMPLIIRYPQMIEKGVENHHLVQNIDFAPTFLELAGIDIPKEIQGMSLKPLFASKADSVNWRDALYYHYYEYPGVHAVKRQYGILKDNFKLIHMYNDVDKWELYDLSTDPKELENLIDNPEYKSLVDNMKSELIKLQIKYKDSVALTQNDQRAR